ncbi:F-actin capping protein, alpha subunit [Panus rudis PR-1116 ss-1]|nr:F-actin capping protein, alpha subunit [Panus rudis PR-1116 ss-1]
MDPEERIQAASKFLLQSPPGEINDVLNDVRNIISDDESLQAGVLPALREYNLAQFITADVPGHQHQTIVSEAARAPKSSGDEETEDDGDRFWDPRSRTSFRFDHISLEASDPVPVEPDSEAEPFRNALEQSSLQYLNAHYHSGVTSVFSKPGTASEYIIQIVANKYNPSNFWSGRWRSEYTINLDTRKLEGKILVNVHYYEQGNVQLSTTHNISLPLPPAITLTSAESSAKKILALIETEEGKYQTSLNESYQQMGEKTFKGLRRALPMTRSKLDWDKVLGYKLGAELSSNKNAFGTS